MISRSRTAFLGVLAAAALAAPTLLSAQKAERPDEEAVAAAKALLERRADAREIAALVQSRYRQSGAQTSAILRSLRMDAVTVGGALAGVYRLDGAPLASTLLAGGFPAPEIVRGSRSLRLGPDEVARTLAKAGMATREIADTYQKAGSSADQTARVLRVVDVPLRETALELSARYGTLQPSRMREILTAAGYAAPAPVIERYSIAGLEGPPSADRLENRGIVDPERVVGPGSPEDGVVVIEGQGLDVPGLSVAIEHAGGTTEGVIRSVSATSVEVEFAGFGSGELVVATAGGTTSRAVKALSYARRTVDQLFSSKPLFTFAGTRAVLVWPLTSTSESTPEFAPPPDVAAVVTGSDDGPVLSLLPDASADARVQAIFEVNPNVNGTMVPGVDCWVCADYKIRLDQCDPLTADCIGTILADATTSLFACANPANWERKLVPYAPVPLVGTGFTRLVLRADIRTLGGTVVEAFPAPPEHTGGILANVPLPSYASGTVVTSWWNASVVPSLMNLGVAFAEGVGRRLDSEPSTWIPGVDPGSTLIGAYGQPDGTLRMVFRH